MSFSEWQKKQKQQEQGVAPSALTTKPQANAATQRPSFAEWHSKKKETSSAQGWLDSVNSFLGDVNNRYKDWNNSSDDYNSIFNRSQELLLAADGWRKQYAGDPNAVNAINQAVDSLGRAQEYSKAYYDFYSQFGSADEYDTWTRKQDFIQRYVEDPDMALVKGGYESGWVEEAEYSKKYSSHATNPDGKMGWEKYLSDQQKPEEEETWLDAIGRYLGNGGIVDTTLPNAGVTQTIHDLRADDNWKHPQADWNEEQKNIYGSLYLDSPYEAEQFAIYTNRRNKEIAEADKIQKIRESATDNFGMGLLHSLGSIATSTMGMADFLANLAEANARGTMTDDGQVSPFEYSQAVQGGISEHLNQKSGTIDEKVPIFGGKGAGDLYSLGMSVLESTASMALGPGGTLVTFFGSAGASAMEDALNRGAEDWQAALYGLAAGVFEGLAEQIGIDNLFRLGGSTTVRETIKNILKQAGAEGAEEGLTALFTNIADNAILQEKSNYYELVSQYQREGMDYNQARAKAWLESVEGVAYDTITGAVSGAVHAAPVMTGQYVSNRNHTANRIYGDNAADLVAEALEIDPSNTYAQKLKRKLDSGKTLSGAELNRLVKQNEKRIKDTTTEDTEETPPSPSEASTPQTETASPNESAPSQENAAEGEYEASEGTTPETVADTTATRQTALNEASKKYGAQAGAMVAIYKDGQDVDSFDRAFKIAFDMGRAGVSLSYAMNSDSTAYLTEKQRELAHGVGMDSANSEAEERAEENKKNANGKTGRRIGTVKGEGVTIKDLRKTFNDTQGVAYKVLTTYAEATGIDIVLFKSEANEEGRFDGAQGRFVWKEDTIYIDINAGLVNIESVEDLAKYTMLRTFAHEFTHFIEKWNPIQYNEFRRVVFDAMTARGENVHDLIEIKQAQSSGMSYDKASREVMAEAMTDILPDSSFVQTLAENHKSIFNKLLEKLKEFVADLKAYFRTIGSTSTREARALKEQIGESVKYVENIVSMFDRIAVEAVESYQLTVATDEAVVEAAPVPSPVEETAPANVHDAPKNADNPTEKPNIAADTTTDGDNGDAFTITDNAEYGTLEIKFDGKPSETVRNALKAHKFRWHGKKGVWYGKGERSDIVRVLRDAYKVEEATPSVETSDESNNKTSLIERAYQIGKKEAEAQRTIVPAAKSKDMNDLMKEAGSNLLPIIESFDKGVADEINRQTVSELDPSKDSDATSTSRSPSNALESIRNRYPGRFIIYQNEDGSYSVPDLHASYPSDWNVAKAVDAVAKNIDVVLVQGDKITEYPARKVSDSADSDTSMTQNGAIMAEEAAEVVETSNETEVVKEEQTVAISEEDLIQEKKAFDKKFGAIDKSKWMVADFAPPQKGQFILDGSLAIRASDRELVVARAEYGRKHNLLSFGFIPEHMSEVLKKATTLVTEPPVVISGHPKPLFVFTFDGKSHFWDKKRLSALDGNTFYVGDFQGKYKILKAVDENGEIAGFVFPVNPRNLTITDPTPSKLKTFSKKKQATTKTTEEVTANADNQGSVLQPDRNRKGDSRLLDEVETRDVQGDVQAGDPVGDPVQRGQETGRSGLRSDSSTGDVGGHGDGGRESADLRRDGGLTEESAKGATDTNVGDTADSASAEVLHEEVAEEIARKSTEKPKGRNFVIGDSLDLPSGDKARYKANVEAIRLVKKLEAEGRYATEDEQVILSKYVGWGGLANAFDPRKSDWAKEYAELSELLTEEEYRSARGSTLTAYYTDISVIKAMYDGLAGLGFDGGMMLEPSAGVGNFVGAMPSSMSAKVRGWTMVEIDGITGLIAKYLYPNANVHIQGFESTVIPDNFMDVAISNVPFDNHSVTDKAYPKKITSAIHNYFFAKALDKVRPGGIVMFITSAYTMNARETTVRNYIMQKADLLGAIRLPDSAFKSNAGTEVVSDILILKKRPPRTPYAGVDFLEAPFTTLPNESYNGAYINTYFTEHPEMVLGTPSLTGSMYRSDSLTYKAFTDRGSLADQIREAFTHIEGKMDYPQSLSKERTNFAVERASKKTKKNGYEVKDGKIYRNQDGELVEQQIPEKTAERIKGLLGIRDAHRTLVTCQQQGVNDAEIKKARAALNKLYDDFVKRYGFINAPANRNAFRDDPDRHTLISLEIYDPDTKTAKKSDVFSVNTITPNRTITSAATVSEGLIISRNETGSVDIGMIAKLTGKSEGDVTRELLESRLVYKTKDGNLEAAETYLSGNVRAKLRDAEAMLPFDVDYAMNIEDLKAVVPKDVACEDIFVNPGTPWIPNSVYSDFAAYILGGRNYEFNPAVIVTRNRDTGNFTVDVRGKYLKNTVANLQKWGTSRRTFLDIFDALLNSRSIVVKNKLDDGSFVVDADATAAANEKMEAIGKEFQDWLWRDEARRDELTRLYNETFNAIVTPKYNGANLTVNGANAAKPLRPHQRDAVQRVIASGGNTLLAHKVGAGKTYEMAAAAMKLKQLGLVKKPMFTVPKSLVAQWGNEFMDFFPTAKLLVADENDFTPANRRVFINRIANGDYDAVILSYEQFEKIPVSDDFAKDLYQEQIDSVIAAIEEARAEQGDKALSIKDLEKKRKTLQAKIDKLTSKPKDDDNILFEQLGVDSLFVDEAHNFKNLFYTTSMTNVAGLGNKDGAERAFDLYTKVRYLQRLNGGRGIVFATATPVMNSMSEMYIMQKYLQPDLLEQLGLTSFDAWAKQFGEVVNGVEIKPSGQGYRVKQSFSRFKNLSELQLLFRNFADVLTEIPGLKIPKMKGGKVNVVVCEPSEFQQDYMKLLEERAEHIKNVDPSVDNMLKITSDGRKISYTQRMIDPSLPYEEGCKIFRCADNVVATYKESAKIKGTQLIFCDMATPKGKSKAQSSATDESEMDMESAHLYEDIRARLIEKGIPAKEIAFIHDADTDSKKKKLFADVNEGKVRVLIGSTAKMGVGMNAQKRVVAIHHLDAPWRPGDVEQRNGRAFRQGNINDEVECFTYATEGSFDARLWDILERKQNFIDQIMNGEDVGREAEDTGEVTLSAAEVKALASGSPWIMEQVQIESDIKKLESLYRAHTASIREARIRLSRSISDVAMYEKSLAAVREDLKARKDTYSEENFSITIGNKNYTVKKDAGVAFIREAVAKAKESDYVTIATFAGFELKVIKTPEGVKGMMFGEQSYPFNVYPGNSSYQINVLVNLVSGLDARVNMLESDLAAARNNITEQEKIINTPFAKQAELEKKRARLNELMDLLNPKEEQQIASMDEDTVQEQSREYLDEDERAVVAQAITSAKTSIKQIPALFKHPSVKFGETNIDIGGGRFDLATNYLAERGTRNLVFDPYNRSEEVNMATLNFLLSGNKADTATCANVLNVIAEERARANVILEVAKAIKSDGTAYFMVYEGNGTGVGAETSSGYQNNRKTIDYVKEIQPYFDDEVQRKGKLIIATSPKENLPKASWEISPGNAIQYQQRTNTLTDREVLSMAADRLEGSPDLTDGERDALRIFKDHLNTLHLLQEERAQQGRLYKEQQFGAKVDKAAASETLNRMHVLDDQIRAANDAVLSVENKEVLRRVLVKARKVVEEQERQHGKEILDRWRERTKNAAAIKKYRERIQSDVNDLYSWITKPDNKDVVKHVPDVLKNAVIPFLTSIDFTSKQQLRGGEATKGDKEFVARLDRLKKALKEDIDMDGMYSGYTDLPVDFMDELQEFIDAVQKILDDGADEFVINRMTGDEMKELSKLVRTLKKFITQINRFHVNAMFQHVYEAGDSTIKDLSHMANDNGRANGVSNFVFWQQMRPAYAFERFGNGGLSIYDGLRRGQAQLAFNTQKIVKFSREAYTEKEVKEWEDSVVEVNLDSGTVKMKVSHMMSFYELSKQPDSLRHMLMGGIRVATFKDGEKIADRGHKISEDDVKTIIGALTPRQKKVADDLQWFMAKQGGAWGNYVSVARFGEEQFTNELYFPINSDGRHLKSMADENPSAASLYALLNMSFTKSRNEKANNRIILYSIFDVFSNHMASMAQYNAMALPVLDAIKWFNYQQKVDGVNGERIIKDSVREQMARVYGSPEETRPGSGRQGYAEAFILNILKAFNGTEAQGIPSDSLGTNTLRRYNMAQIAYNTRVVIQQPLAITRAALLIDYKSIIRGLTGNTTALKQNIAEMQQHSGIAAWKSLGFYDVNISRGLTDLIKHKSTVMDKIGDVGMWGAEMADLFTWAGIWSACKSEVIKKQRITPDHDGFYEAVTSLFEEIIYKTQVVDSILTKNEYMRSKGFFARATSSFMSEPCATASMALDAYYKYDTDIKNGMTRQQSWKKNGKLISRTICVYAVSQAMLAACQAISDAFRDDDEYESYLEKWLDAFGGNLVDELMPLNKLPILSDFYDLAKELLSILGVDTYGNPPQSVFMQWYDSLVKGVSIIYDKIMGEDTNYKWYGGIYKLLQAVSGMTGLPMAAVTREIATIWNNTVGGFVPSLKIKDYEPSELNQIKFAYQDGFLTVEEARAALLENGLADDDDEVYWILQGWDAGDKYSRYDSLNQAMLKGQSIDSAMSELMEHGYTEKEVISHVRGQIGTWYKEGDITREQAEKLLLKYGELNTQEIKSMVDKWSCKIVTGINYDDIKHEYLIGNITEARAIEMRRLYGNETREKAAETVTKWKCEKEVGIAYDDIPDRIINGTLTADDARELYVTYGGYTKQDAAEKVVSLDFVRQHPECRGISYAAVKSYRQYCEKAGVPAEVFYDVWKQRTELKKDGTMAYIHRLNITRKQKDSLYLAMGWSQSTIAEAPWR